MATNDGSGSGAWPPLAAPGLLLWPNMPSNEFAELVELADSIGYSELWNADIRFQRDCYLGLALAARHSRQLLIGPGVSDPYSRHPALIAMAMATLDEISGGRVQIGLGMGGSGLAEMGIIQHRPVRALREGIELIRAMLAEPVVDYEGELFRLHGSGLGFAPLRRAIPIFVATHSPQVLRLAGRIADGVLLATLARRTAIDRATSLLRRSEADGGRAHGSVAVHLRLETCISDDEERALDVVRRRFAMRLVNTYPRWQSLDDLGIEPTALAKRAAAARDVDAVAGELTERDVRSTALCGSVQTVIAQVREALTPEIAKVTIRPLALPKQAPTVTMVRFLQEVWPHIKGAIPGAPPS